MLWHNKLSRNGANKIVNRHRDGNINRQRTEAGRYRDSWTYSSISHQRQQLATVTHHMYRSETPTFMLKCSTQRQNEHIILSILNTVRVDMLTLYRSVSTRYTARGKKKTTHNWIRCKGTYVTLSQNWKEIHRRQFTNNLYTYRPTVQRTLHADNVTITVMNKFPQ